LKVLNQGDFAKRAIELEMSPEEWNFWRSKDFVTVARVKASYGLTWFLLLCGNPTIVHVRDDNGESGETYDKQQAAKREEELLAA
jgi:hypothetical protein